MNVTTAQTGRTLRAEALSIAAKSDQVLWLSYPLIKDAKRYQRAFQEALVRLKRAVAACSNPKSVLLQQVIELCLASRAAWTTLYEAAVWAPELLELREQKRCEAMLKLALQKCRRIRKETKVAEIRHRMVEEIFPNIAWRSFIAVVLRTDGIRVTRRLLTEDTFRILSGETGPFPKEWRQPATRMSLLATPFDFDSPPALTVPASTPSN